MKKIQLTQGFVFALFLFLTACTPAEFNTRIVGRWRPVKLEKTGMQQSSPDMQQSSLPDDSILDQPPLFDEQALIQLKYEILDQKQKGMTMEDLATQFRNASAESQSTYTFFSNGIGIRDTPGAEPMKGKWKVKKRGKLLIFADKGIAKPIRLDIYTLTRTKMVAGSSNLPKGMRLTYIKQ
ncbi:MAG: hypothetical protein ISS17_09245 [Bacteroidales bacterium]|nr:hypothetical protein [Bacteroidales bacterium]